MFEPEIVLIFDDNIASIVVDKGKDGQNDCKLRDPNASITKGINNTP